MKATQIPAPGVFSETSWRSWRQSCCCTSSDQCSTELHSTGHWL